MVTTCKHYDVYSESVFSDTGVTFCLHVMYTDLENYNGTDRHHFNAVTSDQDLVEVSVCI